jgi:hypothetical protein
LGVCIDAASLSGGRQVFSKLAVAIIASSERMTTTLCEFASSEPSSKSHWLATLLAAANRLFTQVDGEEDRKEESAFLSESIFLGPLAARPAGGREWRANSDFAGCRAGSYVNRTGGE